MTEFGTIPAADADTPAVEAYQPRETVSVAEAQRLSPLDQLKADAKKSLEALVAYKVHGRPGYALEFSNYIEAEDVKRYRDNAQGKRKRPEDADQIMAAAQPLIENSRAIYLNGQVIAGSDGEPLTLRDHEWIEIFGGAGSIQALRTFLGDGQVLSMGGALFEAAGYGQDFEPVDPRKL